MSNQNETDAKMLRLIKQYGIAQGDAEILELIAARLESDVRRDADYTKLQEIGKSAYESIADMVAALECDYDRLGELKQQRKDVEAEGNPETEFEHSDLQVWDDENGEELTALCEAAGECESREDAERRIQEDALLVEMRGDWYTYDTEPADAAKPVEFVILLGTGGPATRIIGELDEHGEPTRAWIEAQDWGTPWTDYHGGDSETLLTYCRCFYFGEG